MNYINVKKFGLAVGATGALLYLGCMLSPIGIVGGKLPGVCSREFSHGFWRPFITF